MEISKKFLKSIVAYLRCYSRESTDGHILDEQEKAIREYADKNNLHVAGVFREEGHPGKDLNRPAFQEMMTYCRLNRRRIRFLIVCNSNRLTTDQQALPRLRSFLRKMGIRIISLEQAILQHTRNKH